MTLPKEETIARTPKDLAAVERTRLQGARGQRSVGVLPDRT